MKKIIVAVLAVLALLAGCAKEPINAERVTKNRAVLEKCEGDQNCLLGGFVMYQNGFVDRISVCDDCFPGDVSSTILYGHRKDDRFLNRFTEIALFRGDRERWKELSAKHSEQFVVHRK